MPPSPPTPQTLLDWLAARYPTAKRQTLRRMLQDRRVKVNGRTAVRATQALGAEDVVAVADRGERPRTVDPRRVAAAATRGGPDIVYEDADLLVVDKPPGLLTSTGPREKRPTLLAAVRAYVEGSDARAGRSARVGLIHRLDRDASGLLVFSRTHEAYLSLKRQLLEHTVDRVYTAVVEGVPTPRSGRVESRLVERADGTVYSTKRPGEGERAVTEYEVLQERNRRSLVRVTLFTGRKHQIRVHLGDRGAPIVGDIMYGGGKRPAGRPAGRPAAGGKGEGKGERLMLAATKLAFTHPRTGRRLTFERPAPPAFAEALGEAVPRSDPRSR